MARIYVTRPLPQPGVQALLAAGHTVVQNEFDRPPFRDELLAQVRDADALLCLLTEKIDAELMDAGPRLKVIANYAVGYDNINVPAANERGIIVTNTPDVLTEATADIAWTLLLAASRRAIEGDSLVRQGRWLGWSPTQLLGPATTGKTLGIVGLGRIGAAVARRSKGFGMHVVYTNRGRVEAVEQEIGAEYVGLDELLERSDFISLHAPLTPETRHIIDERALNSMKRSCVLVNTGRGPLIDEKALVKALREKRIAAAGLDVYEREPQLEPGLAELENVVLLPHLGSATFEARGAMAQLACDNILAVLSGQRPPTPLSPEVIKR